MMPKWTVMVHCYEYSGFVQVSGVDAINATHITDDFQSCTAPVDYDKTRWRLK